MNKRAKILIVDDVLDTVEVLSRQLKKENYDVLKAYSAKEGLEKVVRHKPNLVLMDVKMPQMDGFQATRIVREKVKQYIPIIIVTATYDDTENIIKGLDSGADDYITIPCEKEELLARIRAGLRVKELHDSLDKRNRELLGAYNELKRTHEELAHAAKMSALGQFTAGAAHEINNPLGIISGNAQYLLKMLHGKRYVGINEKNFQDILSTLRVIVRHCDRCGNITKNLLRFGRKEKSHKKPTNINEVIGNIFILVQNQLNLSNIKVVKELDPRLPLLQADPSQLEVVFMNLILNARQSMPNGGRLKVRTSLQVRARKRMVVVEVIDTGCGIPKEYIHRIFEPFFTTREAGAGTGLGLSVVYSIIKDHNGEIDVKSKVGKGTTFTIRLPVGKGGAG